MLADNRLNEQPIDDPLDEKGGQGHLKCRYTLVWNWKDCAAKGLLGGTIQLGCLMYEFMPTDKLRIFFF